MAEKLCPGNEVPWATTKIEISLNEFIAEARIWLGIICSLISPCTHTTSILDVRARMVVYKLDNISLNIG